MQDGWQRLPLWGLLAVVGSSLLLSSCAQVHPRSPVGTGRYSYVNRTLAWTYSFPLDQVWDATLAGLATLQYRIHTQTRDGLGGTLEAHPPKGPVAYVAVQPVSQVSTQLRVRIGSLGNRWESERVHAAVRAQLGL